jgi:DNA polymerase sigma
MTHSARRLFSCQPDASFDILTRQISETTARLLPSKEQIDEKDAFLDRMQRSIEVILDGAVVAPFGSAVNGFWLPNSDIDVCIQTPGCRTRTAQIQALRKVASSLHAISSHYIEPRFGARVPIIHWAPRKPGYLACDISVNNNLAVINSRLVGSYCAIDSRVQPLGIVIKSWAKARGINDRSRGTLSSFSLLLMLIHFLQRRSPPILPSLQDLALELNEPLIYLQGADIRFISDNDAIAAEMRRITEGVMNTESLGQLLYEFFRYYGFEYKQGAVGVRDLRQFEHGDEKEPASMYVVDNPFEVGKDVANVSPSQYSRIRQEFRRANSLIYDGATLSEICSRAENSLRQPGSHPLDPPLHSLGKSSIRPPRIR